MKRCLLMLLLSLIVTAGCGPSQVPEKPIPRASNQPPVINRQAMMQLKNTLKDIRGVDEAAVVVINRDVSAALKVTGFNRLRLQAIRSEASLAVKRADQDYVPHITTDKKLFRELQRVERDIQHNRGGTPARIRERVERINQAMQG